MDEESHKVCMKGSYLVWRDSWRLHSLRIASICHDPSKSAAVAEDAVDKDTEAVFGVFGQSCDEPAVPVLSR